MGHVKRVNCRDKISRVSCHGIEKKVSFSYKKSWIKNIIVIKSVNNLTLWNSKKRWGREELAGKSWEEGKGQTALGASRQDEDGLNYGKK